MEEEVLEEEVLEEEVEPLEVQVELKTHADILHTHGYRILTHTEESITVMLLTQQLVHLKENGYIFSGEFLNAGAFCAHACVNEPEFTLIQVNSEFLNPVKEDGEIHIKATLAVDGKIKKVVKISASMNDITLFEGEWILVKLTDETSNPKGS